LSGELRSGAGADDRDLSDRVCSADDRVGSAVDVPIGQIVSTLSTIRDA
jgi:hypothetical protein